MQLSCMNMTELGTTHVDYILCARVLANEDIEEAYEANIVKLVFELIEEKRYNPLEISGIAVKNHGIFA